MKYLLSIVLSFLSITCLAQDKVDDIYANARLDRIELLLNNIIKGKQTFTGLPNFLGGIGFRDGSIMTSSGVFVSTLGFNSPQFTGIGSVSSPITLNPSSVTLQGNSITFSELAISTGIFQTVLDTIPTTYVNVSGDTMTGNLGFSAGNAVYGNNFCLADDICPFVSGYVPALEGVSFIYNSLYPSGTIKTFGLYSENSDNLLVIYSGVTGGILTQISTAAYFTPEGMFTGYKVDAGELCLTADCITAWSQVTPDLSFLTTTYATLLWQSTAAPIITASQLWQSTASPAIASLITYQSTSSVVVDAMAGRFTAGVLNTANGGLGTDWSGAAFNGYIPYLYDDGVDHAFRKSIIKEFGGEIGISTGLPQETLDVNGTIKSTATKTGTITAATTTITGGDLIIYTTGQGLAFPDGTRMTTAASGTGGSTPPVKLKANGDIFIASTTFMGTNLFWISPDTITITSLQIFTVTASTVAASTWNVAVSTTVDNSTWTYAAAANISISSSTTPTWSVKTTVSKTVNIGDKVSLHCITIPTSGTLPSGYEVVWEYTKP